MKLPWAMNLRKSYHFAATAQFPNFVGKNSLPLFAKLNGLAMKITRMAPSGDDRVRLGAVAAAVACDGLKLTSIGSLDCQKSDLKTPAAAPVLHEIARAPSSRNWGRADCYRQSRRFAVAGAERVFCDSKINRDKFSSGAELSWPKSDVSQHSQFCRPPDFACLLSPHCLRGVLRMT
jgi:hypothetical protein